MSEINKLFNRYLKKRGVRAARYQKASKLKEESLELSEALKEYQKTPNSKNLKHLQEEVADVVIVAAAISEKYSFTVEDALVLKTKNDKGRNKR